MGRHNVTLPDELSEWVSNQPELNLSGLLQKAIARERKLKNGYLPPKDGITLHSDDVLIVGGEDGRMHIGKTEDAEELSEAAGMELGDEPTAEEIVEELSEK